MSCCKNHTVHGFVILETLELPDLDAKGIWARHTASGAQVFHLLNDDDENLFAFAFATPPHDSTGSAHILEHTTLCGSRHYPLKDAFLVLAQGSLQTYLNAWTFADKTVYPASSVNSRDYFNLMGVYGDAVFRPLLAEYAFMQEGVRLEVKGRGKALAYNGVVYNEMKGAYSTPDAYAEFWSTRAVLPGTPYEHESGGDPDAIPALTWPALKTFHDTYYSPANCRVFLAGNIPTEEQLAFLNERFFSDEALRAVRYDESLFTIARAAPWKSPAPPIVVPCPFSPGARPSVFMSWLTGDAADSAETLALNALEEILIGHDGSPLARALVESGLGEDLSPVSGLEDELRETVFAAGLRGVDEKGAPRVEALILRELERLATEGIPPEETEAALATLEFSNREIRRAQGPWSLVWLRRSLAGWLHGQAPWTTLRFDPPFAALKERLAREPRFFEGLIRAKLLDNPHRATVTIKPTEGFLEAKEAALAAALKAKRETLSPAEVAGIEAKTQAMKAWQEAADTKEALASIPHLARADLSPVIRRVPSGLAAAGRLPVMTHPLHTNGITYADLAFPVDTLSPDDLIWLPFFSRAVIAMGLPGLGYAEVSSLLARTAGGLDTTLEVGSPLPGAARAIPFPTGVFDLRGRAWLIYRLKALDEKFPAALALLRRFILEADFSDLRRLRDLVLEMKNEAASSLAPSGHSYAATRSMASFTRARALSETWEGLSQVLFAHQAASLPIERVAAVCGTLRAALAASGLIVNLSAQESALEPARAALEAAFGDFPPPVPIGAGIQVPSTERGGAPPLGRTPLLRKGMLRPTPPSGGNLLALTLEKGHGVCATRKLHDENAQAFSSTPATPPPPPPPGVFPPHYR
ncbi:MAG: insulinase family protein [Treponema sp.]|jgi:Zn-dependent M16 (insulinase) family peptidase|nr:insulinase family protein [Treponema sp.]